jgi:tetratricopeptide (TPR) repeat protein
MFVTILYYLISNPLTIYMSFIIILLFLCRLIASGKNHQLTTSFHRFHEPIDFSSIQPLHKDDIQLVWVDRHCHSDDLGPLLNKIDSSSIFFDNLTPAAEYLSTNKSSFQFFVIVSGEFGDEMIQLSEHLSQVHFVFIYCLNLAKYQHLKEKSLKLLTICDKQSELISSIEKAQKSASIAIARQHSMRDLTKESAIFIWSQLLKSLLAKLTTDNEEMAMNDLKEEIKDYYHDNNKKLETLLDELEWYTPRNAIWWYSRQTSLSNIINQALRRQDIDLLYKCRHVIRDLSQALTELQQKLPVSLRVYHGAVLPRESFNKLKHTARQRTFVSACGYLSTSKKLQVAEVFASNENSVTDESGVSVMFEIDIYNDTNVIAADISQISEFPEEEEVLFDMNSTFEILEMNVDEEKQLWTIRMRTSAYGSELTCEYLRYNERELDRLSVEFLFGRLIADMGEFDKSINYFERLVDKENIDQTNVRINLGRAYTLKGDYDNAYKYYYDARELEANENSSKVAEIINNLGWLDSILGNYNSAIEKYRKSLELYNSSQTSDYWQMKGHLHTNIATAQTTLGQFDEAKQELDSSYECMIKAQLPANHSDFSQRQMNLGRICQHQGKYDKAYHYYETALEMRKRALPPEHMDIGKTLYNLGSVLGESGIDYEKSLIYLRESLVINENAVGEEHPATALVWSGIANVYECRDEHKQALKYQFKALELVQKIYHNKDHEDLARLLNNIGELYRRMKDYKQAFLYLNRALKMRIKVLGDDHPETGTVHINLAETYRDTNDYEKAMQHAQQGVKSWREKLLPSATYVAEGEALLVELSQLISQRDSVDKKTDKRQRRK